MSEPRTLRIATRGSPLARAQSGQVASQLEATLGLAAELVLVRTTGDRILDQPLAAIGGKGLFVKEIEEALLDGRADVAIHSGQGPARPARSPEALRHRGRVSPRAPIRAMRCALGRAVEPRLPGAASQGARVGNRQRTPQAAQLLRQARRTSKIVPLRGNVPTRVWRSSRARALDAVVLACAGLERLGADPAGHQRARRSPDLLLPAVAQGTLAIQARRADESLSEARAAWAITRPAGLCVDEAERAFLSRLEAATAMFRSAALRRARGRPTSCACAALVIAPGRRARCPGGDRSCAQCGQTLPSSAGA